MGKKGEAAPRPHLKSACRECCRTKSGRTRVKRGAQGGEQAEAGKVKKTDQVDDIDNGELPTTTKKEDEENKGNR